MLRTFFQTNIHSYSVATSPLESKEKQVTFGVKAAKSAVVALSASSSPSGPHYSIGKRFVVIDNQLDNLVVHSKYSI